MNRHQLERAADDCLKSKGHIALVDVFLEMGKLTPQDYEDWRRGRVPYLERIIRLNLSQISVICRAVHGSARRGKLKASWTAYVKWGRGGRPPRRFTKLGNPDLERAWATHYLHPRLSERKDAPKTAAENAPASSGKTTAEPDPPPPAAADPPKPKEEILVFIVRRDARCAGCHEALGKDRFLHLENDEPLCLVCADLAHLEFLLRGNTALTRRASKHSPLRAVVLEWSRSRQRYERQGILVTPAALRQAEEECLADADLRERRRIREAERRAAREPAYLSAVESAIRQRFPGCPAKEAARIAAWTCEKYSGRVGRSAAAKDLDPQALRLAVAAHIRHEHTGYDALLAKTRDRAFARQQISAEIDRILAKWETGAT